MPSIKGATGTADTPESERFVFCDHGDDVLVHCLSCGGWIEPEWGSASFARCSCGQDYVYKIPSGFFIPC